MHTWTTLQKVMQQDIKHPVCLVAGTRRQENVRAETIERAAALLPRGSFRREPTVGHCMHCENPELVAGWITDLASGRWSAANKL